MAEIRLKVENILTYEGAAKLIGVSRPTIYLMIGRRELHPLEIGGRHFLMKEEVERLKMGRAANSSVTAPPSEKMKNYE